MQNTQNEESGDMNHLVRAILTELLNPENTSSEFHMEVTELDDRDTIDMNPSVNYMTDISNSTFHWYNTAGVSTGASTIWTDPPAVSTSTQNEEPVATSGGTENNTPPSVSTSGIDTNTIHLREEMQNWYTLTVRNQNLIREITTDYNHSFNEYNRNYRQIIQTLVDMNTSIMNHLEVILRSIPRNRPTSSPSPAAAAAATPTSTQSNRRNRQTTGTTRPIGSNRTNSSNLSNSTNRYSTYTNTMNTNSTNPFYSFFSNYVLPIRVQYTVDLSNNVLPPLTEEQIANATQTISYHRELNETRCPISWEEFTEGENITQIIQCGHIFKTSSLNNWLSTHSQCPVCRGIIQ